MLKSVILKLTFDTQEFLSYSFVGGWIFQDKDKSFYGMAINGNSCSKVGIDSDGPEVTPETRNFIPDPERERLSVEFFSKYLPKVQKFFTEWLTKADDHCYVSTYPPIIRRGTEKNTSLEALGFIFGTPSGLN